MTTWEVGFVQSMQRALEEGRLTKISDKQITVLERLYRERFAA